MRILLVNDDGIHAPGLAVLEEIVRELTDDVWVVAPQTEQTAMSHALTTHRPLRIHQHDERHFSVDGTPADCVLLALRQIMVEKMPDFVLSGINMGPNISSDIFYSGTVAAAMEAGIVGIPAIALSQCRVSRSEINWNVAKRQGPGIIRKIMENGVPKGTLLNVNFPAVAGDGECPVKVVRQGNRFVSSKVEKREDPRGRIYYWNAGGRNILAAEVDTDLAQVQAGGISITPISLDLTHLSAIAALEKVFV
ncbi:MAG TPA: 5'/3'-nucleotidase SurE [Rhodospirillaceae bacterium]|nr:MAG: 5'/3'-nucleotidase SurE [Alphaproteobacteria bacterium GWF2_58_20]HAU29356.1 5'/3'-nucleotidase SurE [Rhodospirillaceae bacterium]